MIATGLMAALRARGLNVSPHKVGPDYIDPSYHGLAAGRVGRNLDPMLQGESRIVPLLLHGASTPSLADVAVIEGVMGLFDGQLGGSGFSSTAHVARLVSAPVVLVVDCAAASRSVGAVVHGFSTYDADVRVAGVILNNVASPRHEAEVRASLVRPGQESIPVLGVVPRLPEIVVPSRHLGLIPVAERTPEAVAAVDALATLIADHVDLDLLLSLASSAPDLDAAPWSPSALPDEVALVPDEVARLVERGGANGPVVAVFGGPAFSFTYAENVEQIAAAGAHVVTVDPLQGDRLPDNASAIVIGGGFPEMHLDALAANADLLADVATFARAGGPVVAECAGLLYLGRALDGVPMAEVVPMTAAMTKRLTLGYRRATALVDGPMVRAGEEVTGHEFHKTSVSYDEGSAAPAWSWDLHDGTPATEGWVSGNVHASYLHVHGAGHPEHAERLVAAATEYAASVLA
jgi:cobyrinic acid a,c-diamide synthase